MITLEYASACKGFLNVRVSFLKLFDPHLIFSPFDFGKIKCLFNCWCTHLTFHLALYTKLCHFDWITFWPSFFIIVRSLCCSARILMFRIATLYCSFSIVLWTQDSSSELSCCIALSVYNFQALNFTALTTPSFPLTSCSTIFVCQKPLLHSSPIISITSPMCRLLPLLRLIAWRRSLSLIKCSSCHLFHIFIALF